MTGMQVYEPFPLTLMLPILFPKLEKDIATLLQALYDKVKKKDIDKEYFIGIMIDLVGDHMLKEAVLKARFQESTPTPTPVINSRTSSKKPSAAQKKPLESFGFSPPPPPTSKKQNASTLPITDQSTEAGDAPDSRVLVGNYYVNKNISSILHSILNKYGDIAEGCKLKSVALRSSCLESVCFMIQELQSKAVNQFRESKLKEMLAIVKDSEAVGINVGWLSPAVDRIREVLELIKQKEAVEAEKREFDLNVETMRKDLAEKEKAVSIAKARLCELEQESLKLSDKTMSIKSKVDSVDYKSMVSEML